ncbi:MULTISPECIES: 4Fe-4S binding protein [unclassified Fusibacter]|uniref:4Fe-4S binding protein n=1 Tax=unclassified Fusibacter TaxID=2624464 RepID=UPI001011FF17|nr:MULTISPECIES: 4Fe-4S binding protein [unclassified Fusibacter]MCK8060392.1 4Fe-4S binding protein [Fusibacter sp. A2]NPE20319.1 4Fe-4S binding protein [Fusibacter sp. A1]RXV63525.1 dihydroorotate dehydrogenase [Fusibacter sp. A1]
MNKKVNLFGLAFDNPLLPASGPLCEGLENLLSLNELLLGGLVTKTISVEGAQVKKPCIVATKHMVYNTELWSEHDLNYWIGVLPTLVSQKTKPLGISVGYTKEQLEIVIPKLEGFADFFEISTHYNKASLESMVRHVTGLTDKPVLIKMSPHVVDDIHFVETVMKAGASGIVALNSFGPGAVIDLKNRSLLIGNEDGHSWISGPAIKPFALQRIARLRKNFPDVPIIGCGGIETATDVLEMILAGADLVQMLSTALINGRASYSSIVEAMDDVMVENAIESVEDLRNTGLDFSVKGRGGYPEITDRCIGCQVCVRVCPFMAYEAAERPVFNQSRCIRCGLCESRCMANAIEGVLT